MRLRTPRPASPRRGSAASALGVVVALAAVSTAGSSSVHLRPGDTLSGIAARFSTTVSALRAANGLTGDRIYAGSTLRLPGSGASTTTSSEQTHVVRAGDTVSAIAHRYGVSVSSVQRRNGLSAGATIQPGQRLVVPGSTAQAPVQASGSASAATHRAALQARSSPSRDTVRAMVAATARRHGVDVPLALAIAHQESGFQQHVVSPVDAIGVMQVLPSTARSLSAQTGRSLDLLDTQDNVTAGVLLLRQLLAGSGSDRAAIAAYYQGLGSIADQGLLPQTHAYVRSVEALRASFRGN